MSHQRKLIKRWPFISVALKIDRQNLHESEFTITICLSECQTAVCTVNHVDLNFDQDLSVSCSLLAILFLKQLNWIFKTLPTSTKIINKETAHAWIYLPACFSNLSPTGNHKSLFQLFAVVRLLLNLVTNWPLALKPFAEALLSSDLPNLTLAMSTAEQKTCSHSLLPTCLLPPTVAIQISQISEWILAVLLLDRGAKYLYPTRRRVVLSLSVCGRHEYALVWRRPGTTLSWSAPPLPSVALKTGSSTPSCTEHWDSPWSLLRFMQADPCTLCTWYTCQIAFFCLDRRNK